MTGAAPPDARPLDRLLRRDRLLMIAALSAVILASWAYVLAGAGMGMTAFEMSSFSAALGAPAGGVTGAMQAMAVPVDWTAGYAVLMFFMWWVMMTAMMLPSAAPMILLHGAIDRKSAMGGAGTPARGAAFAGGYLAVWALFSALAAGLQWGFEAAGLLSPMTLSSTNTAFAAAVLAAAGLYQLIPLKQACLRHCRGPVQFLTRHWRPGAAGAFRMGLRHGAYCLGCCWGLMALLFFGGIMNLYWIIVLAAMVLAEKLLPAGPLVSRLTGGLFLLWAAGLAASAIL
jgi:predicted metal-binding membrane protein